MYTEYAILITRADGSKALRGLPVKDVEPSEAVLAAEARAYDGIEAHIIGKVGGQGVVTDVDYAPDGTKTWTRTRPIGSACDCGKGDYCPQWGRKVLA